MVFGRNKKLGKKGKSSKKKADVFTRKNWYEIKAPAFLDKAAIRAGRTCVTKTTGRKIETDSLKGRVGEFNMADLISKNEDGHKKMKLEVLDIAGRSCLTDFYGLELTRDKIASMIKKRRSLVEVKADVRTLDGYVVRVFVVCFTMDTPDQVKVFSYAQAGQIRKLRKKIQSLLQQEVGNSTLQTLVSHLIANKLENDIEKATKSIYPCDPVNIWKVKIVKKPKEDLSRLYELHGGANAVEASGAVAGGADVIAEVEEAKNLLS